MSVQTEEPLVELFGQTANGPWVFSDDGLDDVVPLESLGCSRELRSAVGYRNQ
jgi:hypothetical protein